jgi:hypothetical protein
MDALVGLFGGHPVPLEYNGVDCMLKTVRNCLLFHSLRPLRKPLRPLRLRFYRKGRKECAKFAKHIFKPFTGISDKPVEIDDKTEG